MGCSFRDIRHLRRELSLLGLLVAVGLWSGGHQVRAADQEAGQTGLPSGTGLLAGRVVDADTGEGIAGAFVALAGQFASPGATVGRPAPPVTTDSQGRFVFPELAAGTFLTIAQMDGFKDATTQRTPIVLKDGERITSLVLPLHQLSSISGTVRERGRDPVVAAEVVAFRRSAEQGRPPSWVAVKRTATNDRGEYRLSALTAGDYYLCVCGRAPLPFDRQLLATLAARPRNLSDVMAAGLGDSWPAIPPTFYPGVTTASQTRPIHLRYGEDRQGTDVAATAARTVTVSGRITFSSSVSSDGATALSAATLTLVPVGDIPEAQGLTQLEPMLVQPDGRFDFVGVPPGTYTLEFHLRQGARGTSGPTGAALALIGADPDGLLAAQASPPITTSNEGALWASVPVSVGDTDIDDLVVAALPTLQLRAHVEFVGTTPAPIRGSGRRIGVSLDPLEQRFARTRNVRAELGMTDTLSLTGIVPGRYVVTPILGLREWQTVDAITLGGVDVTDTVITVDASTKGDLVMTLKDTPPARISGRVIADADSATRGVVLLFPSDRRLWPEPFGASRRFRAVPVGATGEYALERVPAGEYFLAVTPSASDDWINLATLETLSRDAQLVRVADGEQSTVEIKR